MEMNDYILDKEAEDLAQMALNEMISQNEDEDWARDYVYETVDCHEYVIYYYQAHQVCQNCNTDDGEAWLEDCGGFMAGDTYDSMATKIAFGELMTRTQTALEQLLENYDEDEAAEAD